MATCGHCKAEGQTIEHVRACSATLLTKLSEPIVLTGVAKQYVESKTAPKQSSDYRPMALVVPDSHYAVEEDGQLKFFAVKTGKKGGRWEGFQFLTMLVGAPGGFDEYPVKGARKAKLMAEINKDAKAAAIRYSREFTVCAACGSPLTDPESMAIGLGPICASRF
jgi:hypothetical protein